MQPLDAPPACGGLTGQPFVDGANGPELEQRRHARAAAANAMLRGRVNNGVSLAARPGRVTARDVATPQPFVIHPRIAMLVDPNTIGADIGGAHLPGRVPPTAWDGEPGMTAPRLS